MKMMKLTAVLTLLVAIGCSQRGGPVEPHPELRLHCCSTNSPNSATNWLPIATGREILACPYTLGTNGHATIWFRFPGAVWKRTLRTLLDDPSLTRFRVMREQSTVAEFDFDLREQVGSGVTVCVRTTPEEAKRIITRIRR